MRTISSGNLCSVRNVAKKLNLETVSVRNVEHLLLKLLYSLNQARQLAQLLQLKSPHEIKFSGLLEEF